MPLAPQEIRTYFITTVTASRRSLFQVERNALLIMEILETQRVKSRMEIHAFVIMPDHVHLLLTPAPEVSLERAMQFIKGGFSFHLKSKMDVWERSTIVAAFRIKPHSTLAKLIFIEIPLKHSR